MRQRDRDLRLWKLQMIDDEDDVNSPPPAFTDSVPHRQSAEKACWDLGNRCRERREKLGFSASFVASSMGVSAHTLTAFESGQAPLDATKLAALAAVLMVRVTWFFVGCDEDGVC